MIKLTETERKNIDRIIEITGGDYNPVFIKENWYLSEQDLVNALYDLTVEYDRLESEKNDLEYDLENNYIPVKEDEPWDESDFH